MKRDGVCKSLWQHGMGDFETAVQDIPANAFDVLIIGGGITGLTTALLLQHAGKSCIIAEAHSIGFGTTGGTTAHLNTFYDTPYSKIIKNFGRDNAELLAHGAKAAIGLIKQNISTYNIECDFKERDGYIFSINESQDKELDDLVNTGKELGLPVGFINDSPFPIPYLKVGCLREQAQFHPAKYIYGLAKAFTEAGGVIIENCCVTGIEKKDILHATCSKGIIQSAKAIYATHIPPGVNILHFRCAPYRSYAMAFKLKHDQYPIALGYDMSDPYHYYRTQNVDGQNYLIAGGEDHKTGHEENTEACFRRLESYVKSYFDVAEVSFRWSSQYFEPADGIPYIGHLPGNDENIYVATGFGGNGMIYGTLSGLVLSNIIINGHSNYEELFSPARVKPVAGFSNFVKEAADVVKELVGGIFSADKIKELSELAAGEARIVKYNGHVIALYKDKNHQFHAVNSACTHIKCTVAWNAAEQSWDCPCHGSRFSVDGITLTAPARRDLEKIPLASYVDEEAVKSAR
ncbi:MAG: FAD-dependent oxidoreductase [Ferruginibacter sp.]